MVPDGPPIDLRVDAHSPRLDALLDAHGARGWAFVTACNPDSRRAPVAQNAQAQAELARALDERGWRRVDGLGIPDDAGWSAEASFLVIGIGWDEAVALGRTFGQKAIVAGERGGVATLIYCKDNE